MSKPSINIQDGFLFQNLKESTDLRVELLTGSELAGRIRRFDRFALILELEDGEEILVYKHAVSAIGPARCGPPLPPTSKADRIDPVAQQ